MGDNGIRPLKLWLPIRCDSSPILILQDTNASADTILVHHGQNQENEEHFDDWIKYFPFEKFFDGKYQMEKNPQWVEKKLKSVTNSVVSTLSVSNSCDFGKNSIFTTRN